MKRIVALILGLAATFWLAGCGSMGGSEMPRTPEATPHGHSPLPARVSLADPDAARAALLEQYLDWAGVPYRMGGASRQGLDCSGFARLTYLQRFGIELPRDTSAQLSSGSQVPRSGMRPGDLVFFQTGAFDRHVGIYLGELQFLHVSASTGVMLSRLDDEYWQPRFRYAIRVGG
jgi:cell wall-associated NlpC family hydrolase